MIKMLVCIMVASLSVFSQTKDDYNTNDGKGSGLLDPSRLSVSRSISLGMASYSSSFSDVKSQSIYSTMLQYKFTAPVTLNLDFGLPIFSTFTSTQNFTPNNLKSLDYFKSVPFDVSLSWQPLENCLLQFSISKNTYGTSSYFPYFFSNDLLNQERYRGF